MSSLDTASEAPRPSLPDLFTGFLKIGLMGFGGVGPVARHIIVAERNWLDDRGYAELMGICQALPGANTPGSAEGSRKIRPSFGPRRPLRAGYEDQFTGCPGGAVPGRAGRAPPR